MDMVSHLRDRGIAEPSRYRLSWDTETACFLIGNLSNQIIGYQQYRPFAPKTCRNDPGDGRYYTYCKNKLSVWGLETFYWRNDVLFLTEGIFDAVKLHNQGLPAIACLANDPKLLHPWLKTIWRKKICVCDGDAAGLCLAKSGNFAILLPTGIDLGDMSDRQVNKLLKDDFQCGTYLI